MTDKKESNWSAFPISRTAKYYLMKKKKEIKLPMRVIADNILLSHFGEEDNKGEQNVNR